MDSNIKFTKLAIKELQLSEMVGKWKYEQLAQFLIQDIWGNEDFNKFGTLRCSVLDRVIEELFKIQDEIDNKENCNKILQELANSTEEIIKANRENLENRLKPNKNIEVPEYDKLSEGMNPDNIDK